MPAGKQKQLNGSRIKSGMHLDLMLTGGHNILTCEHTGKRRTLWERRNQ